MKKLLFTLGIFLHTVLCLPIQAETATIDSLKRELQLAEQKNSTKEQLIELYQFLGAEYETLDHDSSYHYIQKGLSLYSKPTFEEEGYLQLLNSLANYLFMEGKIEQAKEKFKTVATHAPQLKERRYDLEGVVESSIGVCYRKLGMFDSAVYHYNRAIDLCKKTEKYEDIASTYYNIGVLYHLNKRYEEALTQGKQAAEYARKAKDSLMELYASSLIGGCYSSMGKYVEASHILKKNINKALELKYPLLAMSSLSPLLSTYQLWNKKDSVRIFLKKGEELIAEFNLQMQQNSD